MNSKSFTHQCSVVSLALSIQMKQQLRKFSLHLNEIYVYLVYIYIIDIDCIIREY